jgi:hypothetical protein
MKEKLEKWRAFIIQRTLALLYFSLLARCSAFAACINEPKPSNNPTRLNIQFTHMNKM